jgi:hypothetical protein
MRGPDNAPVLQQEHNYITLRGYFNGPDEWVARQKGQLRRPVDVSKALVSGIIDRNEYNAVFDAVRANMRNAGYDGTLLGDNDILLSLDPSKGLVRGSDGRPDARICNFELVYKV